jgi:hypothetical protein
MDIFSGEEKKMNIRFHEVGKEIIFKQNLMILTVDGKEYKFNLNEVSEPLLNANKTEREFYKIDQDGYGIHWMLIDEDLSIDGLLGIRHYSPYEIKKEKVT